MISEYYKKKKERKKQNKSEPQIKIKKLIFMGRGMI